MDSLRTRCSESLPSMQIPPRRWLPSSVFYSLSLSSSYFASSPHQIVFESTHPRLERSLCALHPDCASIMDVLPPATEASDLVVTEITMSSNPRDVRLTAASSHPRQSLDSSNIIHVSHASDVCLVPHGPSDILCSRISQSAIASQSAAPHLQQESALFCLSSQIHLASSASPSVFTSCSQFYDCCTRHCPHRGS